jgi:hypothetical protein
LRSVAFDAAPDGVVSVRLTERQAEQVLNEIAFLRCRQIQIQAGVVMVDDLCKRREAAIVVKPAFQVREERTDRRRPIAVIGCAIGLK